AEIQTRVHGAPAVAVAGGQHSRGGANGGRARRRGRRDELGQAVLHPRDDVLEGLRQAGHGRDFGELELAREGGELRPGLRGGELDAGGAGELGGGGDAGVFGAEEVDGGQAQAERRGQRERAARGAAATGRAGARTNSR